MTNEDSMVEGTYQVGYWAAQQPEKVAVVNSDTGDSLTYSELNKRSIRLARLFRDNGLVEGDHVACYMENHIRFLELVWAVLRSGLYITPINSNLKQDEAGYILENSDAKVLVTSYQKRSIAEKLPMYAKESVKYLMFDGLIEGYESYEDEISKYSPVRWRGPQPEGSFMLYSSGTTGRPKGVAFPIPGREVGTDEYGLGVMQRLLWGCDDSTVNLIPAPLYHAAAAVFAVGTTAIGGTLVIMQKFDALKALQAIDTYRVTHSQWVPTMFQRMLNLPRDQRNAFDLSSHLVAIHAAAPCPKSLKSKMFEWWGDIIHEYYGGTESIGFTYASPSDWIKYPGTVGRSLTTEIRVCDDSGQVLPAGAVGKIYFVQVPEEASFQYYKEPEKTKGSQHPTHPNWSTMGDIGYVNEEGYLFLTDRQDFMIISGGVNIYPQEVEDILIEHPDVFDAAVVGVPSQEMGEDVKAVVQLQVEASASKVMERNLIDYSRERLSHYKCPKSIDFVEELPRTPTGKLRKVDIRKPYWI